MCEKENHIISNISKNPYRSMRFRDLGFGVSGFRFWGFGFWGFGVNITKMLFDHPDFLIYKKTSIDVKKARSQLDYIKKNNLNEKKAYQNQKI